MERGEAGAAADVAGQAVAEADAVGALVVEEAAAQEQVAGRADRRRGAGVAHQRAVVVVEVDAVRIDRALAHQAEVLRRPPGSCAPAGNSSRAQRTSSLFSATCDWIQTSGYCAASSPAPRNCASLQLGREARRDRVAQALASVPAPDQRLGVESDCSVSSRTPSGEWRSCSTLPAIMRRPRALRRLHQRVDRMRVRGAEGQRGRHAVAQQLVEEDSGHARRACAVVGKARLVREGVVLQPGQQALGGRADHVGLRKVHVQVDEARREDAARQVRRRHAGEVGAPARR